MASGAPSAVIENRFGVPPEYAAKWLTDFRSDDGVRFFGFDESANVQKTGDQIHVEAKMPFGRNINDIHLDSSTHWSSRGRMLNKKGKVIALTRLDETVRPEGSGTVHRVEMFMEPQGLGARIMFAFAGRGMLKGLREGFAKMKAEMEQQYTSGAPPS